MQCYQNPDMTCPLPDIAASLVFFDSICLKVRVGVRANPRGAAALVVRTAETIPRLTGGLAFDTPLDFPVGLRCSLNGLVLE